MSDLGNETRGTLDHVRAELSALTTEAVAEELRNLDTLPTDRLVTLMNEQDQGISLAVAAVLPQISRAIDDIADRMRAGGRLIYIGAGTAGRLGILDASECPPTFNTDPSVVTGIIAGGDAAIRTAVEDAEDDAQGGADALEGIGLNPSDVVVGISASGRTRYVVGALEFARRRHALSVAVACNPDSLIGQAAHHAIEVVVGPEIIAGSTRLKAGTAQKLVLNMISTVTMIRLGKTYGNIMVGLQPTNEKLRARAEQAVMLVTGRSAAEARRALARSEGSVKTAVLMLSRNLTREQAAAVLAKASSLRAALGDPEPA
ncbi:N-acetylmuramic acid 6-phosphate etherase [Acrocarpospora macrocephala]|uniref:N-acetylmuramic acid 6-phosphate etherase n=1 Tax=Acrocarpospora macrocephala TaxID=150177 RepID=A0A5M3WI28_9ACTN|nr:N-acetylmuramic acid 6-phosphate etherase [Acrocarpospora macrocephala]GES06781.1 N-acetylmuramic acid 6-phosphate etherase [Acrocarpospora macrocephala]